MGSYAKAGKTVDHSVQPSDMYLSNSNLYNDT